MRLKDIVRAPKDDIKIGEQWHTGKVPRADFPLAKGPYALGSAYRWNVIKFQALGVECRVLIVLNEAKEKYQATLGVMGPSGMVILCTYEYHASEPGWHCHATHDDSGTLTKSFMRSPWIKRVPGPRKLHRTTKHAKFKIGDEKAAIRFAIDRYKIRTKGTLL